MQKWRYLLRRFAPRRRPGHITGQGADFAIQQILSFGCSDVSGSIAAWGKNNET